MTHEALTERRTKLLEQLREVSVAAEQIKGAIALCDEFLAADPPPPPVPSVEELAAMAGVTNGDARDI